MNRIATSDWPVMWTNVAPNGPYGGQMSPSTARIVDKSPVTVTNVALYVPYCGQMSPSTARIVDKSSPYCGRISPPLLEHK